MPSEGAAAIDNSARLRAAATLLDEGACQCGEQFVALRGTSAVCRDAAAEIERLRSALTEIARHCDFDEWELEFVLSPSAKIAQEALNGQ